MNASPIMLSNDYIKWHIKATSSSQQGEETLLSHPTPHSYYSMGSYEHHTLNISVSQVLDLSCVMVKAVEFVEGCGNVAL